MAQAPPGQAAAAARVTTEAGRRRTVSFMNPWHFRVWPVSSVMFCRRNRVGPRRSPGSKASGRGCWCCSHRFAASLPLYDGR